MKRLVPPGLAHLRGDLASLHDAGLLRLRPPPVSVDAVSFCSNDYLGLAAPQPGQAAVGAGASRLVAGEHPEHGRLERALSEWLGTESSLLFTSGYAANVGVISAFCATADDLILSDELNHASIVDGCRLARGEARVYAHLDIQSVRDQLRSRKRRRAWVVTESYFSMDADSPDLGQLRAVCDEFGAALVVDEAHALGVFGPRGRGLLSQANVVADVTVGTFGKSFGAGGAFATGCDEVTSWLWNRARSFVFSTGLSPVVAEAALGSLARIQAGDAIRASLFARAEQLRGGLRRLGIEPLGYGHVVPWVLGDSREAVHVAERLRREGFAVQAIRPPSVAAGSARVRFAASARQSPDDIDRLLGAIGAIVR